MCEQRSPNDFLSDTTRVIKQLNTAGCVGLHGIKDIAYKEKKKKKSWPLPFVVDPFSSLDENETRLHKLLSVFVGVWKRVSKAFVEF